MQRMGKYTLVCFLETLILTAASVFLIYIFGKEFVEKMWGIIKSMGKMGYLIGLAASANLLIPAVVISVLTVWRMSKADRKRQIEEQSRTLEREEEI